MRRAALLISLSFAVYCGAAVAATPIFQLNTSESDAQRPLAIDAYPSSAGGTDSDQALLTTLVSRQAATVSAVPPGVSQAGESLASWSVGNVVPVSFSSNLPTAHLSQKVSSIVNNSDDMLFYFLRDFEAKPQQKPGRWALLLVGLCFVLYQVRRRPMRASIGFFSTSRPAWQFGS
ncbi:hypothetical protein [Collimonas arenae]|uniref:hypothetical protein n=1 Tax=Collimonas arenae TaxID=279058 RepID=UPI0009EEFA34|nr:hypothetical protein [Collimonas arenae]